MSAPPIEKHILRSPPPGWVELTWPRRPTAVMARSEFGRALTVRAWMLREADRLRRSGRPAEVVRGGDGKLSIWGFSE